MRCAAPLLSAYRQEWGRRGAAAVAAATCQWPAAALDHAFCCAAEVCWLGCRTHSCLGRPERRRPPACCSCRCPLFTYGCWHLHSLPNWQGPGASAFSWRKRDKQQRASLGADGAAAASSTGPEEGSLFVEPLRWMCEGGGGPGGDSVVGGAVQGKLYCPK